MRAPCGTIFPVMACLAATVCMAGVSKVDSRYFADEEGKTFVPIGCNICFPRVYDAASPESRAACEEKFFGWLRSFAANGGNFTRLWLGHPFFEIMPERPGEYAPAAVDGRDGGRNSAGLYALDSRSHYLQWHLLCRMRYAIIHA